MDCVICSHQSESEKALNDHFLTEHPDIFVSPEDPDNVYQNKDSDAKQGSSAELDEQNGSADEENLEQNVTEIQTKINDWTCQICRRWIRGRRNYIEHHQKHHIDNKLYCCAQCDKFFPKVEFLKAHMNNRHMMKNAKCDLCKKPFSGKHELNRHVRTYHNATHTCKYCNESMVGRDVLEKHIADLHLNHQFKCEVCERGFSIKEYLNRHLERNHRDAMKSQCTICKRKMLHEVALRQHMSVFHAQKQFQCSLCQSSFINKKTLNNHVKTLHNNELEFPCPECSERFSSEYGMKHHYSKFHSPKEWNCKVCFRSYLKLRYLQKHVRESGHVGTDVKTLGDYVCEFCNTAFHTLKLKTIHVRRTHVEKKWGCDMCEKAYINEPELKRHKKKVHPVEGEVPAVNPLLMCESIMKEDPDSDSDSSE